MNKKRERHITIRVTEVMFQKILAMCDVTGKTKTGFLRDLIAREYGKNKEYERRYLDNLNERGDDIGEEGTSV